MFIQGEVFIPRGILVLGEVRGRYSGRGECVVPSRIRDVLDGWMGRR